MERKDLMKIAPYLLFIGAMSDLFGGVWTLLTNLVLGAFVWFMIFAIPLLIFALVIGLLGSGGGRSR